jgi:Ras family protein
MFRGSLSLPPLAASLVVNKLSYTPYKQVTPLENTMASSLQQRVQRNVVVLGMSMVGKTAICVRFANDRFDEEYEPTYENSWHKLYPFRGRSIECIIKDTQGLSDQEVFRHEYGLGYHGYLLVYSIDSMKSLETLKGIHSKLLNLTVNNHIPRVLVGNKMDMARTARQVPTSVGKALADEWGCSFMECSAQWNNNVDQVFEKLFDEIEMNNEPDCATGTCLDLLCCGSLSRGNRSCGRVCGGDCDCGGVKLEPLAVLLLALLLLCGVAGMVAGFMLLMEYEGQSEGQLLAFVSVLFGATLVMLPIFGLIGVTKSRYAFCRVYTWSVGILTLMEVGAWVALLSASPLFKDHLSIVAPLSCVVVLFQLLSGLAVYSLQQSLKPISYGLNSFYSSNIYYDMGNQGQRYS